MTVCETEAPDESPMDLARDTQTRVSEMLGDPDHSIDVMALAGPVGRFTYIGRGAPLECQVKPALMCAISDLVDERVYAHEPESPEEVQDILEQQLVDFMDPFVAEHLAAETAERLADWSDFHGQGGEGSE